MEEEKSVHVRLFNYGTAKLVRILSYNGRSKRSNFGWTDIWISVLLL